jgi:hypothetical protein
MTIELSSAEMARSWLVEHYRRQGWPPLRTLVGVGILVLGGMSMLGPSGPNLFGGLAIAWGAFLTLRPIAFAGWILVRHRRTKPFVVTVDGRGVEIRGAKGTRMVPWTDITAWGLGSDYLWYEVKRGPRAIIPFRVMSDRPGLEALFRGEGRS